VRATAASLGDFAWSLVVGLLWTAAAVGAHGRFLSVDRLQAQLRRPSLSLGS
jgi:hypothetical protein